MKLVKEYLNDKNTDAASIAASLLKDENFNMLLNTYNFTKVYTYIKRNCENYPRVISYITHMLLDMDINPLDYIKNNIIPECYLYNSKTIKQFKIPKNIKRIQCDAFWNSTLESVDFSDCPDVTIGSRAFNDCNLKTLDLSQTNISILENDSFRYNKNLSDVKLPKTIKQLRYGCFYDAGFKTIELPEGLEEIREYVFGSNDNLKVVKIPASVYRLDKEAFAYCGNIEHFEIHKDSKLEKLSLDTFWTFANSLKTLILPERFRPMVERAKWFTIKVTYN